MFGRGVELRVSLDVARELGHGAADGGVLCGPVGVEVRVGHVRWLHDEEEELDVRLTGWRGSGRGHFWGWWMFA